MQLFWNIFMVVALMAGSCAVGYFLGHRGSATNSQDGDPDDAPQPAPMVQTALIRQGHVDRKIVAYGVVTAQSGDVSVLSVPFESRVKKIDVVPGQRLDAGAAVIDLDPSSDSRLELLEAKSAADSAAQDLQQTKTRYASHLATNQDLLQSQQNLQAATLKLQSLQSEGAGSSKQLKSAAGGLVIRVDAQEGQLIPGGAALVEIATPAALQVRLGVEPQDAPVIHPGDQVSLQELRDGSSALAGTVHMVSQQVDPDTRMIDVFVTLPSDAALPMGDYLSGELSVAGADTLVVPVSAVLPDDEGYSMFTVEQGKAVQHKVSVAAKNDEAAQITGDGLAAGQLIVVSGNLELADGMSVKTDSDQAATAPSSNDQAAEADK
jgi:membrane fusion protein, multidrug efflux system